MNTMPESGSFPDSKDDTDLERGESEELYNPHYKESHDRHLYDGYPDYHLSRTSTGATTQARKRRPSTMLARTMTETFNGTQGMEQKFTHPLSTVKTGKDVLVDFDSPEDPYKPINWPFWKRAYHTLLYSFVTLGATWGSSVYSSAIPAISREFRVAEVVSTLGVTLYLFGFGIGPMIWAPLSEVFGRKKAVLPPYFVAICFAFGSATAKDFQTLMITRFFTGLFGSAPVTNTGGVLADLWSPKERGPAMAVYSMSVAGGPLLAPIVGGAIVDSYLSWRWVEYITGILMSLILIVNIVFVQESFGPKLLVYKARRLRHETGNWALHAAHEEWDVSLASLMHKYMLKPFQLLFTPVCFCMAVYASFVYGILYLCFAAFPIEFQEERGWNSLIGSLPFLGTFLGCVLGALTNILNTSYYMRRVTKNKGRPVPEARLPPMMFGAIIFPAGCFLFGWTSSRHVFWLCPIIGAVLIGLGFVTIFQCALNYLIDTFQEFGASAVAGNTALRSAFAGVFPLFAPYMFRGIGIGWASSVIGFVAVLMIPIPFLFFLFGERLRARGKWSRASCN